MHQILWLHVIACTVIAFERALLDCFGASCFHINVLVVFAIEIPEVSEQSHTSHMVVCAINSRCMCD